MRYRLGILSGVAITGIVALALASGIVGGGSVEAARPSVTVITHSSSSAPTALQGSCDFSIQIAWEGNAFSRKNGYYHLFLTSQQADAPVILDFFRKDKVAKGTGGDVVEGLTFTGTPGTKYHSWIVFFRSKGKDGKELGRQLVKNDLKFSC